jgi:hypothetical protein
MSELLLGPRTRQRIRSFQQRCPRRKLLPPDLQQQRLLGFYHRFLPNSRLCYREVEFHLVRRPLCTRRQDPYGSQRRE